MCDYNLGDFPYLGPPLDIDLMEILKEYNKKNKKTISSSACIRILANESGRLTLKQIESGRRAIREYIKSLNGVLKIKIKIIL
jgi:ribosomal protein L16/L10AE